MKIAIDPGHGMSNRTKGIYDPGATHKEGGTLYEEASIVVKYALTLKDILRTNNHEIFLTRDDAEDHAPLTERAKNAKSFGAEKFISIHINDCENDEANGLEVIYNNEKSKLWAQQLQSELIKATGFKDRGIKKMDLAVLKFQGQAVLIELGFIANDHDRNTLLNPQKRQRICSIIADNL